MDDGLVWYLAYGSNLSRERLRRYLDGCPPVEDPVDAVATTLSHRLFFAHESRVWTGGTAFVDPTHDDDAGTLATAWLLRVDQFLGIVAGENGRTGVHVDPADLPPAGAWLQVDDRRYGLVLGCHSPDARRAYTVTTPETPLPAAARPVAAYADTIVAGLVELHGLSVSRARSYLEGRGA